MVADDEASFRDSPEYRRLIDAIRADLACVGALVSDGAPQTQIERMALDLDRLATEVRKQNDLLQRLITNGGGR